MRPVFIVEMADYPRNAMLRKTWNVLLRRYPAVPVSAAAAGYGVAFVLIFIFFQGLAINSVSPSAFSHFTGDQHPSVSHRHPVCSCTLPLDLLTSSPIRPVTVMRVAFLIPVTDSGGGNVKTTAENEPTTAALHLGGSRCCSHVESLDPWQAG